MILLTDAEMKNIYGGFMDFSSCSVQCSNGEWKERDCGAGSTCSSSGTTIACNSEPIGKEMCKVKPI